MMERTEILIQDDCTPDHDLRELIGGIFKVERNETNVGFAANCNEAAKRAKGEYLCFMNQDIRALTVGWADYLLMALVSRPDCGIVGPKLIFPESMGGGIQSCGGLFDGGKGPFHRYLGWHDIEDRRVNTFEEVSWITGACLAISRALFEELGGFDAATYERGYFEDVDLCMRVRFDKGLKVFYQPGAVLEHPVGSTGGSPYFMQNSTRFHARWDAKIVPDVPQVWVNY